MTRIIKIDGRAWRDVDDVLEALLLALGAPHWHGRNFNALADSIGTGSINAIEPPYLIRISGAAAWPADVRDYLRDLRAAIATKTARTFEQFEERRDVEIVLEGDF